MTSGLEELIAGISSRSPRSASTTPRAASAAALNKITRNNLATPPQSQSQPSIPEEEEEQEEEMGHKHNEPATEELKRTAPVRKAKRHLRQEQESANTDLSDPNFLNKQFPRSRVKRVLKRGGATGCAWKVPKGNKMGIEDIIRVHALARVARLTAASVEFSTQKQYDHNGNPIISCDKEDPSKIDDATKHNFKLRLEDIVKACKTLCNANIYSDELYAPIVKQQQNNNKQAAPTSSGASESAAAEEEEEKSTEPVSKKQKVSA